MSCSVGWRQHAGVRGDGLASSYIDWFIDSLIVTHALIPYPRGTQDSHDPATLIIHKRHEHEKLKENARAEETEEREK